MLEPPQVDFRISFNIDGSLNHFNPFIKKKPCLSYCGGHKILSSQLLYVHALALAVEPSYFGLWYKTR